MQHFHSQQHRPSKTIHTHIPLIRLSMKYPHLHHQCDKTWQVKTRWDDWLIREQQQEYLCEWQSKNKTTLFSSKIVFYLTKQHQSAHCPIDVQYVSNITHDQYLIWPITTHDLWPITTHDYHRCLITNNHDLCLLTLSSDHVLYLMSLMVTHHSQLWPITTHDSYLIWPIINNHELWPMTYDLWTYHPQLITHEYDSYHLWPCLSLMTILTHDYHLWPLSSMTITHDHIYHLWPLWPLWPMTYYIWHLSPVTITHDNDSWLSLVA